MVTSPPLAPNCRWGWIQRWWWRIPSLQIDGKSEVEDPHQNFDEGIVDYAKVGGEAACQNVGEGKVNDAEVEAPHHNFDEGIVMMPK